jgi:hypothetical protein
LEGGLGGGYNCRKQPECVPCLFLVLADLGTGVDKVLTSIAIALFTLLTLGCHKLDGGIKA